MASRESWRFDISFCVLLFVISTSSLHSSFLPFSYGMFLLLKRSHWQQSGEREGLCCEGFGGSWRGNSFVVWSSNSQNVDRQNAQSAWHCKKTSTSHWPIDVVFWIFLIALFELSRMLTDFVYPGVNSNCTFVFHAKHLKTKLGSTLRPV